MMKMKVTSFVLMAAAALLLAAAPARAQEYTYNRVLQLDGNGDYVEALSPPSVGTNMAVEAWIKTSVRTGDQAIISRYKAFSGSNLDDSYLLSVHEGRARFQLNPGDTFIILDGNTFVADGQWHHIVGSYSSGNRMELIVDGVSDVTRFGVSGALNNPPATNIRIGALYHGSSGTGFFFNGQIDEVRLWNGNYSQVSSASRPIRGIPIRNSTGAYPLLAAWRFNGYPDTGFNAAFVGNAVEVASLDVPLSYDSFLDLGGNQAYLFIQGGSSLTPTSGRLTIQAWVRSLSRGGSLQSVVSKYRHNSNSNTDDAYFLGIEPSGVARFQISVGGAWSLVQGTTSLLGNGRFCQDFDTSTWHHLAGVFDGSELRLYVDGQLEARGSLSGAIASNSTPLYIGASQEGPAGVISDFFDGYLDDIRIWDSARSENDIRCDFFGLRDFRCVPTIGTSRPVAQWLFEGDFINLVNYRSGSPRFWGTPAGNVLFCSGIGCLPSGLSCF